MRTIPLADGGRAAPRPDRRTHRPTDGAAGARSFPPPPARVPPAPAAFR
ncbi:hypothetical protein HNR12_001461 [Streptomonospora nanhaiensis]|uniref:Uncharacterized protein n=1 Tax=Streptomonospora nanhaiensis TaxID=1323731 RepID=A0A853BKE7_9ACTN|nr:hypothetical protein [Streptomonospora nanhaiensis]